MELLDDNEVVSLWWDCEETLMAEDASGLEKDSSQVVPNSRVRLSDIGKMCSSSFTEVLFALRDEWKLCFQTGIEPLLFLCFSETSTPASEGRKSNPDILVRAMLSSSASSSSWFCSFFSSHLTKVSRALKLAVTETQLKASKPMTTYSSSCGSFSKKLDEGDEHASATGSDVHKSDPRKTRVNIPLTAVNRNDLWHFFSTPFARHFLLPLCLGWTVDQFYSVLKGTPCLEVEKPALSSVIIQLFFLGFVEYLLEQDEEIAFKCCTELHKEDRNKVLEDVRKNIFSLGREKQSSAEDAHSVVETYALEMGMRIGLVSLQHFFLPKQAVEEQACENHLKAKKAEKAEQNGDTSRQKGDNDQRRNRCVSTTTANDSLVEKDSIGTRVAVNSSLAGALLLHVFPACLQDTLEQNAKSMASFSSGSSCTSDAPRTTLLSEAVRCTFPILQLVATGWITVLLSRHLPYGLLGHPYHYRAEEKKEHGGEKEEEESSGKQLSKSRKSEMKCHPFSVSHAFSMDHLTQTGVDILHTLEEAIRSRHNENPLVQSSSPMVKDAIFARYDAHEKMNLLRTLQCITHHYLSWDSPTRVHCPSPSHFFSLVPSMSGTVEKRREDSMALAAWWLHVTILFLHQWVEVIDNEMVPSLFQNISMNVLESTVEPTTSRRRTEEDGHTSVRPHHSRTDENNNNNEVNEEGESVVTQECRRLPLLLCRAAIQLGNIFICSAIPPLASFLPPYYVMLARVCYRVEKSDEWRAKEESAVAAPHDVHDPPLEERHASTRLPAPSIKEQKRDSKAERKGEKSKQHVSSFSGSSPFCELPSSSASMDGYHCSASFPFLDAKPFFSDVFLNDLFFIQRCHPPSSLFCPLKELVCPSVRSYFHSSSPSVVSSSSPATASATSSFGLEDPTSLMHHSRTLPHLLPLGIRFFLQPQETLEKMIQLTQECPPNSALLLSRGDDGASSKGETSSTLPNGSQDTHHTTTASSSSSSVFTTPRSALGMEPIRWEEEIQRTNRFTVLSTDIQDLSTSRAEAYRSSSTALSSCTNIDTSWRSRSSLENPAPPLAPPFSPQSRNASREGPLPPPSFTHFPSLSSSQALYAAKVFHPRYVFLFSALHRSVREVSQWVLRTTTHFRWITKQMWTLYTRQGDKKEEEEEEEVSQAATASSASDDRHSPFFLFLMHSFLKALFSHALRREVLHRECCHDPAVSAVRSDLLAFCSLVLRAERAEKDPVHPLSLLPCEGTKENSTETPTNDPKDEYREEKGVEDDVLEDVREALAPRLRWKCYPPTVPRHSSVHIFHFLSQRIVSDGEYGYTYFFLPSLRAAGVDDSVVERWEDLLLVARVSFFPTVEEKEVVDGAAEALEPCPTSEDGANASLDPLSHATPHPLCGMDEPPPPQKKNEVDEAQVDEQQKKEEGPLNATMAVSGAVGRPTCFIERGAGGTPPLSTRWLSFGSVPRELVYLTQLPSAGYCSSGVPSLAEHLKDDAVQWWQTFLFDPFTLVWEELQPEAEMAREGSKGNVATPEEVVDGSTGVSTDTAVGKENHPMVEGHLSDEDLTAREHKHNTGSHRVSSSRVRCLSPSQQVAEDILRILVEAGTVVVERMLQLCGASSAPFSSVIKKVPLLSEVDMLKIFFLGWWRLCDTLVVPSSFQNESQEKVWKMYQSRQYVKHVVMERIVARCHLPPIPSSPLGSLSFVRCIAGMLARQRRPASFPSTPQEEKESRSPKEDIPGHAGYAGCPPASDKKASFDSFTSATPTSVEPWRDASVPCALRCDGSWGHSRVVSWAMTVHYEDLLYDRLAQVTQTSYMTGVKGGASTLPRRCYTDYRSSFSHSPSALMHLRQLLSSYEIMKKNTTGVHVREMTDALLFDAAEHDKRKKMECVGVSPVRGTEKDRQEEEEEEEGGAKRTSGEEKVDPAGVSDGTPSLPLSPVVSYPSGSSRSSTREATYLSALNRALRVRGICSPTEAAGAAAAYRQMLLFTLSVDASRDPVGSPSLSDEILPPLPPSAARHATPCPSSSSSFWLSAELIGEYWSKLTLSLCRLLSNGKGVILRSGADPSSTSSSPSGERSISLTLGEITAMSIFLSLSVEMWREVSQWCGSMHTSTETIQDEALPTPNREGTALTLPSAPMTASTLSKSAVGGEDGEDAAASTATVRRNDFKKLVDLLNTAERRLLQDVTEGMKKFVQSERAKGDAALVLLARAFQPYLSYHKGYTQVVALATQRVARLKNAHSRLALMELLALPIALLPASDQTSRTEQEASTTLTSSPSVPLPPAQPEANASLPASSSSSFPKTTNPTPSSSSATVAGGVRGRPMSLLSGGRNTSGKPPVGDAARPQERPSRGERFQRRPPHPLPASGKEEHHAEKRNRARVHDGVPQRSSASGKRERSDDLERTTHSTPAHIADGNRHRSRRTRVEEGERKDTRSLPSTRSAAKGNERKESEANRHSHAHHSRRRRG